MGYKLVPKIFNLQHFAQKPATLNSLPFSVSHTENQADWLRVFPFLIFGIIIFLMLNFCAAQPCLLEALPVGPAGGRRLNGITRVASLQADIGLARMVGEHIPVVVDCQGKIGKIVKISLT